MFVLEIGMKSAKQFISIIEVQLDQLIVVYLNKRVITLNL